MEVARGCTPASRVRSRPPRCQNRFMLTDDEKIMRMPDLSLSIVTAAAAAAAPVGG